MKGRINRLDMTVKDVIIALSGGNPGAITACAEILKQARQIDPDAVMGGLDALLMLDTLSIYDDRIWMLYKDVCKQDTARMIAVLRAWQLGQFAGVTTHTLNHAIDNRGDGIDLDTVMVAVKKRLPKFNALATEPAEAGQETTK